MQVIPTREICLNRLRDSHFCWRISKMFQAYLEPTCNTIFYDIFQKFLHFILRVLFYAQSKTQQRLRDIFESVVFFVLRVTEASLKLLLSTTWTNKNSLTAARKSNRSREQSQAPWDQEFDDIMLLNSIGQANRPSHTSVSIFNQLAGQNEDQDSARHLHRLCRRRCRVYRDFSYIMCLFCSKCNHCSCLPCYVWQIISVTCFVFSIFHVVVVVGGFVTFPAPKQFVYLLAFLSVFLLLFVVAGPCNEQSQLSIQTAILFILIVSRRWRVCPGVVVCRPLSRSSDKFIKRLTDIIKVSFVHHSTIYVSLLSMVKTCVFLPLE